MYFSNYCPCKTTQRQLVFDNTFDQNEYWSLVLQTAFNLAVLQTAFILAVLQTAFILAVLQTAFNLAVLRKKYVKLSKFIS